MIIVSHSIFYTFSTKCYEHPCQLFTYPNTYIGDYFREFEEKKTRLTK